MRALAFSSDITEEQARKALKDGYEGNPERQGAFTGKHGQRVDFLPLAEEPGYMAVAYDVYGVAIAMAIIEDSDV